MPSSKPDTEFTTVSSAEPTFAAKSKSDYEKLIIQKPKTDIEALIVGMMSRPDGHGGRQYLSSEMTRILLHRNPQAWQGLTAHTVDEYYTLLANYKDDSRNPFACWEKRFQEEKDLCGRKIIYLSGKNCWLGLLKYQMVLGRNGVCQC